MKRIKFKSLVPNMITLTGLCFGLSSIRFAFEDQYELGVACILIAAVCDTLDGLMKRADQLDAIIVETTGLADPAPVAQTFFVDQDVSDRTKLDAIVTVADAVHLSSQLGSHCKKFLIRSDIKFN